ncbi:conserved membrane protein of unknown function [Petrocella atlantisensis]|uniref:NfeD-like C-terminal domain-containing protein n=1 Tax=Petrocella atlantisensis TaxID=2173034 RepID=A0A3P7PWT4_9FIRM|nr:hypothetical protein [Petrocella atlantisensis]PKM54784.1 MAG: hypothetical protein CVV00_06695 [Firmicutes bacterium HGW-Firmicutes-5]VDN47691.1 conserved membrane protein of unknown function [Petrocella atlantisensis]
MSDWWEQLNSLQRFFYFIAIPSTVILIIQSILTLIGFGLDTDMDLDGDMDFGGDAASEFDMDLDSGPGGDFESLSGMADFRFVTFRGLIAFATMFGWIGAAFASTSVHFAITLLLALAAGLFSMFVIALLFYGIAKLQSSGNLNYRLAIGKEAQVYIPIPGNKKGQGKIQLMLQERLVEVDAITEEKEAISTGETILIVDMLNATTMVVERLK